MGCGVHGSADRNGHTAGHAAGGRGLDAERSPENPKMGGHVGLHRGQEVVEPQEHQPVLAFLRLVGDGGGVDGIGVLELAVGLEDHAEGDTLDGDKDTGRDAATELGLSPAGQQERPP